jgi:hypothetical protein
MNPLEAVNLGEIVLGLNSKDGGRGSSEGTGKVAVTETRSTSTTRVKAHRARKSRGVYLALIEVPEAQVDRLADKGYLDGDNTLGQAIEAFLADHLPSSRARL